MTIQKIINRKSEAIQFLIMALLSDTYSDSGLETFMELFRGKLTKENVGDLRMATKVNIHCESTTYENMLQIDCAFRGHEGYPGGEFGKELKRVNMIVDPNVLMYLLHDMSGQIEEAKKAYLHTIASGNAE